MTLYNSLVHTRVRYSGLIDPKAIGRPWFLTGNISSDNCLAAYMPKGATSFAISKVNLASPGTYDLSDGSSYPTWAKETGWTFNNQWLYSSLTINYKPCTYIARVKMANTAAAVIIGGYTGSNGFSFDLSVNTLIPRFLLQDVVVIGAGTSGFSASVDAVVAITYSSDGVWTHYLNGSSNGSGTYNLTAAAHTMMIGAQYNYIHYVGDMMALAVYNTDLTSSQISQLSAAVASL